MSDIYHRPIGEHGGKKYIRRIRSVDGTQSCLVDVYCVIEAFGVTCAARQHALKKLLTAGLRGKGSQLDDIKGVFDAMWRALEMQEQREKEKDEDEKLPRPTRKNLPRRAKQAPVTSRKRTDEKRNAGTSQPDVDPRSF